MAKCGYPPCPVQIDSGGDTPPVFCEKHLAVKCNYPPCPNTIVPNADVCEEHLKMVQEFDWIHAVRHMQMQQRQEIVQQNQDIRALLKQVRDTGNVHGGQLIVRKP